jgi:hypothetical protein
MPHKVFLETYPLYRKFKTTVPGQMSSLAKPRINMACPACKSSQTFAMTNEYWEGYAYMNFPSNGNTVRAKYLCTHCQKCIREFLIRLSPDLTFMTKVGQWPAWEIESDPLIEQMLGAHADHYKKGLVCESQSYGIGAFSYYRRIVEEIIDSLLDEIQALMAGEDLVRFKEALAKTKNTIVTQEKIDLVKDLLPPILRPDGMNPLGVLHSALSEGLHAESDDKCLEQAAVVREVLVFLVNQVHASKASAKSFTEGMRKLLEKKSGKAP